MEIIGEILLGLLEVILGVLYEIALQLIGELLIELGIRSIAETRKVYREHNPVLAFIGYGLVGVLFGYLSVVFVPKKLFVAQRYHGLSLIISPIVTGLIMSGIGALKRKAGKQTLRLDTFLYGFVFALGVAVMRYVFTK